MTLDLLKLAKQNDGESSKLRIAVIDALKTIHDPEIPINIYDLGLIYKLEIDENGKVDIDMTLTAPGCPVAQTFPAIVANRVKAVPGVSNAHVEIVWEPPWEKSRMSELARIELGLF
jgi:FeS assembly SUF system protein